MSFESEWREPRQAFQAQPRGPPRSDPIIRLQQDWSTWHTLTLRVTDLPQNMRTIDLWSAFHEYGNLVFINIFANRQGEREGSAIIRFQPPPKYDFWTDNIISVLTLEGVRHYLSLYIDKNGSALTMKSPLRKNVTYPRAFDLKPLSLGFGVLSAKNTIMSKRVIDGAEDMDRGIELSVNLYDRWLVSTFFAGFDNMQGTQATKLRFRLAFEDMTHINLMPHGDSTYAMVISLDNPPKFFKQPLANLQASHSEALSWNERWSWIRATEVAGGGLPLSRVLKLSRQYPIIDMGRWTTYMFVIKKDYLKTEAFEQLKEALLDFNIEIRDTRFTQVPSRDVQLWRLIDGPESTKSADALQCMLGNDESYFNLPFEVRYQLEVCVSHAYLEQHSLDAEFIKKVAEVAEKSKDRALAVLEWVAVKGKRVFEPMSIFTNPAAMAYTIRQKIPPYCAYARKAIITPTAMYFGSPTVEISNRVIRHYASYGDRFIRVQFTDENRQGRINAMADKTMNDALYARVYYVLLNGIQIGDRHYEFLAFGNSQFREHGAYFFAPTDDLSCADIRKWMGRFSDIRVPAKYASRLGLCFSTTRAIKNRGLTVVGIPDVERNGHCFTDGVGKISKFMMRMIANDLGLLYEPSVIQFRMGGCKGILAAWPDMKPYEVHIRKSQAKFAAEYMGLEIIRSSKFSSATLNRQTILILSALGVGPEVFCKMLDEQLANYNEAMVNPEVSIDLLTRYIDDAHSTMGIAAMVHNGFQRSGDPFVNSLLHLWRSWSIKLLKEKAKIIVEKGAFVFGCTDETGTLKGHVNMPPKAVGDKFTAEDIENLPEIFLQIPNPEDRALSNAETKAPYVIMTGLCIIGRNPSLHPGDIRVVRAVDVPALHHLKDVVVFSQQGDIDVPRMCSGGDLDGDDFFVIWDRDLIPQQWNAVPMSYDSPEVEERPGEVTIGDVIGFFVRYMKNDSLPTIANAHLAHADRHPESIRSQICLELASLHSKAVDYVKTGVPAVMKKEYYPVLYPHFMEKNHLPIERTYRSNTVLGQLYDRVEKVEFMPQYEMPFDSRILKAYPQNQDLLKLARQLKTEYDAAMRRTMAQFCIKTEFEIWTSFLLSKPVGFNSYQAETEMALVSDALKQRFKTACESALGGNDFKTLGPFAAAMYQVTWEELHIALQECKEFRLVGGVQVPKRRMEPSSMPLISYPWLYQDVLGRVACVSEPAELDLNMPMPKAVQKAVRRTKATQLIDLDDMEDVVYTADGVTHRGEVLDIFKPENKTLENYSEDENNSPRQRVHEYMTLLTGEVGGVGNMPSNLGPSDPYNIMLRAEVASTDINDADNELASVDGNNTTIMACDSSPPNEQQPSGQVVSPSVASPSSTATTGFDSISDIMSLMSRPRSPEREVPRPFSGAKQNLKPSNCSVSMSTNDRLVDNGESNLEATSPSVPIPTPTVQPTVKSHVFDLEEDDDIRGEADTLAIGETPYEKLEALNDSSKADTSVTMDSDGVSILVTPSNCSTHSLEEPNPHPPPIPRPTGPGPFIFRHLNLEGVQSSETKDAETRDLKKALSMEVEISACDKPRAQAPKDGDRAEVKPTGSFPGMASLSDALVGLDDSLAPERLVTPLPERKLTVRNPDSVVDEGDNEKGAVAKENEKPTPDNIALPSGASDDDESDYGEEITFEIQESALDKLVRLNAM